LLHGSYKSRRQKVIVVISNNGLICSNVAAVPCRHFGRDFLLGGISRRASK
jgi:hypothetical protein